MSRKPPLPPKPRHNRPLAQPKIEAHKDRLLTSKLMARINRIIEKSGGKLTRRMLGEAIDKGRVKIAEWLGGRRSAPNSESTLLLILWGLKNDPDFMRFLNGKTP